MPSLKSKMQQHVRVDQHQIWSYAVRLGEDVRVLRPQGWTLNVEHWKFILVPKVILPNETDLLYMYTAKCPKADGYIFEFRLEYILIHVV